MARASRLIEYALAAGFTAAAFIASPLGIELITGRADLSFRVTVIGLAFALFLLVIALAVLAQGRLRQLCFYAAAIVFPFVLLAGLEAGAVAVQLADIVAPLEDTSVLANKRPWPKHLLSNSSYYITPQGFVLYRPWQGDGITFNALGLRTAMPAPKKPGEWRIAVTGGSAAWGWKVVDADTIPVQLQDILRRDGRSNVTVYNFGVGGATARQELALLKHFRDTYAIDQVLFYTGANDVINGYIGATNKRYGPWVGTTVSFELIKAAVRLQAIWSNPSPQMLQWLDGEVLPAAVRNNTLREAIVAAEAYCREAKLACDFALQPMMFDKPTHTGSESRMMATLSHVYPRMDVLAHEMYRAAMAAGPAGHMFDLSHAFDQTAEPLFLDHVHLSEAGNRMVAVRLVPIVKARLP